MPVVIPEPNQSIGSGAGLLIVKGNEQLDREMREESQRQTKPEVVSLGSYVRTAWQAARDAKTNGIEREMLAGLRARKSQYSGTKMAAIQKQGGSKVYMGITDVKCTDAESWIKDVLFPDGERSWGIKPTPAPEIPPSIQAAITNRVQQEVDAQQGVVPEELIHLRIQQIEDGVIERFDELAKDTSERMQRTVDDQFVQGSFYEALNEAVFDICTFPAAILRRSMKMEQTLTWSSDGVKTRPIVEKKAINYWYRASPLDIYPSPESSGINDGYLIEHHRLRRSALIDLKGTPGFSDQAINLVLNDFGTQGLTQWLTLDQERADLEGKELYRTTPDNTIDAIEFHGEIQGILLLQFGMSPDVIKDPLGEYEANVWVIGPHVIKATLNKDPLLRRPYFKASYQELPGSFWGRGIPKKMEDVQTVCNGIARALANNVAIASGPQVEVFTDRISGGEDITSLFPWKIWQMKADPTGAGHRALNFDQPDLIAGELTKVYEFFSRLADDHTGIPPFGSGAATQQQAGSRAAAGIAMLLTTSAKGIKQVISNIDKGLVAPAVERNYQWNMQFNPDESIKGDVEIEVTGARSLVTKEQIAVRRQEFLTATANPFDAPLMGQEGRATLLRKVADGLDMPGKEVVPRVIKQIGPIPEQPPQQTPGAAGTGADGNKARDFSTESNRA